MGWQRWSKHTQAAVCQRDACGDRGAVEITACGASQLLNRQLRQGLPRARSGELPAQPAEPVMVEPADIKQTERRKPRGASEIVPAVLSAAA